MDQKREILMSRRQIMLAGASLSLATTLPVFASETLNALQQEGTIPMTENYVTTKDGVEIFYKDWGPKDAQPIVFHHGWPLSSDDWDAQMLFFLLNGYRVVAHDRRGHGRSQQVSDGHDLDHYAADAAAVFEGITVEVEDTRKDYGERRIICYGSLNGRLVVVGYTKRGAERHVFSMRKANEREQTRVES